MADKKPKIIAKQELLKKYGEERAKELLKKMMQIRRFEEKAAQMYGLKKIGGFCHLYIGEEAAGVGSIAALDLSKNYVIGSYRDHGLALACGMDADSLMAELYGKKTGCSKGKGGSMHFFSAEKHMLGGNGIVGGQIPVATGIGYKIKYKKEDGVVLCYFGDGAISQGAFHESLNMAKVWDLPVIYICENNQYSMGTAFGRVSSVDDLSVIGGSYDIESKQINGMDALIVYDEMKTAVESVRKNPRPLFFEIKTYRYKGHSMSDPAKYRTKEELEEYKNQDPIIILQKMLIDAEMTTEEELKTFDDEAKTAAKAAVDFAENSDEPELESLYTDVYA